MNRLTMATYTMFVYGTLKTAQPNHKLMDAAENGVAKFLGRGHTVNQYPLVIASCYNIPFLLYKEGRGKVIQGEFFEVDEKMLARLDQLENHPNFYERNLTRVVMTEDDQGQSRAEERQSWVYFLKRFKPELLDLPCYESYDSRGDHGLAYVEKSKQEGVNVRRSVMAQDVMSK